MTTESKIELYSYKQASEILGVNTKPVNGWCQHCAYLPEEYEEICFNTDCGGGIMIDSNKYSTTPEPTTNDSDR